MNINNVSCGYNGTDVVHDVSFSVQAGEVLCIAGPNGSGKSTLLKAMANLLPYSGNITIADTEVSSLKRKELARHVALLSQSSQVYFPYTVYDTVALGRYAWRERVGLLSALGSLSDADRAVIGRVMERLGLADVSGRLLTQLSGGQTQRVFLAKTIVQEPEIILLDEPTNHLDLRRQIELLESLREWVSGAYDGAGEGHPRALVAVLHDLNMVQRFADRVVLLSEGRIAAQGRREAVLTRENLLDVYAADVVGFMRESLGRWV
jgi:iron complex transport system ATP-binding protein